MTTVVILLVLARHDELPIRDAGMGAPLAGGRGLEGAQALSGGTRS